jgi:hypothetical protein
VSAEEAESICVNSDCHWDEDMAGCLGSIGVIENVCIDGSVMIDREDGRSFNWPRGLMEAISPASAVS